MLAARFMALHFARANNRAQPGWPAQQMRTEPKTNEDQAETVSVVVQNNTVHWVTTALLLLLLLLLSDCLRSRVFTKLEQLRPLVCMCVG